MADEIMARIERDGAVHRSSLIDVILMLTGGDAPQPQPQPDQYTALDERIRQLNAKYDARRNSGA